MDYMYCMVQPKYTHAGIHTIVKILTAWDTIKTKSE